jgi:hypothetical protein
MQFIPAVQAIPFKKASTGSGFDRKQPTLEFAVSDGQANIAVSSLHGIPTTEACL